MHEELTGQGFKGGYTIVREYLNALRPKPCRERPFLIVCTDPGEQAQVDWSPYALADGTPLYAFSCILSYSRYQYVRFCTDMRQPTVFRQLQAAFALQGGIAKEYVFDSMPGVVDRWELDEPVLNLRAVDFAAYHDFGIHVAPRANGSYKGKVERPFRFLEESFFNARTFHTFEQATDTLIWWLENRANNRDHGTTGIPPVLRLEQERPVLRPLPPHPYDSSEIVYRLVDPYGYVSFDGNFYRAPDRLVGRWVYVRACESQVWVIGENARPVASHPRQPRGQGARVPPPTRREPRRRLPHLLEIIERWGPTAAAYAHQLEKRKRYAALELSRLLELQQSYRADDIVAAITHAQRHAAYDVKAVERILQAHATPLTVEDELAERTPEHIRSAMSDAPIRQRELGVYARLLQGPIPQPDAPEEPCHAQESLSERVDPKDS